MAQNVLAQATSPQVGSSASRERWVAEPQRRGQSLQLVVIVRGLGTSLYVADLQRAIEESEEWADADIINVQYNSELLSPEMPVWLADNLNLSIEDAVQKRCSKDREGKEGKGYQEIVLVGQSIGALLVRAAYAMGYGKTFKDQTHPEPSQWVGLPVRLVLLAGINLGWSIPGRDRARSFWRPVLFWFNRRIAKLFGAKFMPECERDSVFIVDLRNHWLELVREGRDPHVIQLQGFDDDLIDGKDCIDLKGGNKFLYRKVQNTTHFNLGIFSDETYDAIRKRERDKGRARSSNWRKRLRLFLFIRPMNFLLWEEGRASANTYVRRKEKFLEALSTRAFVSPSSDPDLPEVEVSVARVVLLVHGILTLGGWFRELGGHIQSDAKGKNLELSWDPVKYGWFPVLQFIMPWTRRRMVREFVRRYTAARAKYPRADVDVVAHSYGTYLVCQAMDIYSTIKFKHVALAGSIVSTNYPWDERYKSRQVEELRNYTADRDYAVACFPAAYQKLARLIPKSFREFIGNAGVSGFNNVPANTDVCLSGGHSVAVTEEEYQTSIARFVLDEQDSVPMNAEVGNRAQTMVNWSLPLAGLCLAFLAAVICFAYVLFGAMGAVVALLVILIVLACL